MDAMLYKLLPGDRQARIYFIDNTAILRDAPAAGGGAAAQTFRTLLTFTCLLHGLFENAKRVSIKLETPDPSAGIVCGADCSGDIQGFVSDRLLQRRFDSLQALAGESGSLKLIQDNGAGAVFTGVIDMRARSLDEDLAHYFLMSEQTPTLFKSYHNENMSRGVLIQALPFADEGVLSGWARRLDAHCDALADSGAAPESLLKAVFHDARVVEQRAVRYRCACDRQSVLALLLTLSADDIDWAMNGSDELEIKCGKCARRYSFGMEDIRAALR